MQILHAFWLPEVTDAFVQTGVFLLWAETLKRGAARREDGLPVHPFHLTRADWPTLVEALGAQTIVSPLDDALVSGTLRLPGTAELPLPSPSLARDWLDDSTDAPVTWQRWQVDCLRLDRPIKQLSRTMPSSIMQPAPILRSIVFAGNILCPLLSRYSAGTRR